MVNVFLKAIGRVISNPIVLVLPWLAACSDFSRPLRSTSPPQAPSLAVASPQPLEPTRPSPTAQDLTQDLAQDLAQHIRTHCWITYTPTAFDPRPTPMVWPSRASVEADLAALRRIGVEGLVTYRSFFYDAAGESDREILPLVDLAAAAGFKAMVVGVWDPGSEAELAAAEAVGGEPLVWGYSVGNEGLGKRYDRAVLTAAIDRLRQATGKPIATTEETPDYFQNLALYSTGDWIFANIHPYFAGIRDPDRAAAWTARMYVLLSRRSSGGADQLPIVFKEVGLPTAGAENVSEAQQAAYYRALKRTEATYVNFAAFDLPWKQNTGQGDSSAAENPEPYWGVLRADRSPKPAAQHLCDRL